MQAGGIENLPFLLEVSFLKVLSFSPISRMEYQFSFRYIISFKLPITVVSRKHTEENKHKTTIRLAIKLKVYLQTPQNTPAMRIRAQSPQVPKLQPLSSGMWSVGLTCPSNRRIWGLNPRVLRPIGPTLFDGLTALLKVVISLQYQALYFKAKL